MAETTTPGGKVVRAIVADDEEMIRDLAATALRTLGCEVVGEASDGLQCMEMFEQTAPDLVVLDIRMPTVHGMDTLAALLGRHPEAYVVMLTAVDDDDAIRECIDAGAQDYIKKTQPAGQLIERLREHVNRLGVQRMN